MNKIAKAYDCPNRALIGLKKSQSSAHIKILASIKNRKNEYLMDTSSKTNSSSKCYKKLESKQNKLLFIFL